MLCSTSNFSSGLRFVTTENISKVYDCQEQDESFRQKYFLSLWAWWILSLPIQGNLNLLSLLFSISFLLSLSFSLFSWLSFRFFFCLRNINSVFLTLFITVDLISPQFSMTWMFASEIRMFLGWECLPFSGKSSVSD